MFLVEFLLLYKYEGMYFFCIIFLEFFLRKKNYFFCYYLFLDCFECMFYIKYDCIDVDLVGM